jgi:hypothetical protein
MLYHRLYDRGVEWIREETERGVQSLGGRSPLYSGILVSNMDADEFTLAIEAGLEGGADGVSLFHGNAMTEDQWKVFRRVVEDWETSGIPQENNPR